MAPIIDNAWHSFKDFGGFMPTYSYKCDHCDHEFEKFQKITAEPTKKCPKCGKKPRRLIGNGVGIIFKGSGWTPKYYNK